MPADNPPPYLPFRTTRPLKIVDCSVYHDGSHVFNFDEPGDSEREKAVWTQIDQACSETTTPSDNTANYVPNQVIAELFKIQGFGGIAYKSAFGCNGHNIAIAINDLAAYLAELRPRGLQAEYALE